MSIYPIAPISLDNLETYPLASRPSKVRVDQFAQPYKRRTSFQHFINSLPKILAAQQLREIAGTLVRARARRKKILWGIGGHVIKVGLAPVLIDLMNRGYVSGIAMNGAAMVHDFEIGLAGGTSEDVEAVLGQGQFGMAEETGRYLNEAAANAHGNGIGLGEAAGELLVQKSLRAKHLESSILASAYRARIPVTVHLAIGTDIPHMHRLASGASLGASTHHDFRLFCAMVKQMHPGGIYLNWGSAVVLPEIFLKAVTIVRNLGTSLHPITTANFDFIQHYRPLQNVVKRPTAAQGGRDQSKGYTFTGHHEILMPLLAAVLIEAGQSRVRKRT
jgi:hypothetical protein